MRRETWWPIGLASALGLTVAANVVMVMASARGDGAAVLPDYYRRAVAWDSSEAARTRSAALGWRLTARLDAPSGGTSVFTLALADSAGARVSGARVRLEGFALARSGETHAAWRLEEAGAVYAARLPVRRAEWYEMEVTAVSGGARFVATLRCLPGQACRPS